MKSLRYSSRTADQANNKKSKQKPPIELNLEVQQVYWNYIENEARWIYNAKQYYDAAAEKFETLKSQASQLPAALQEKFWIFVQNQIKFLIKQETATFYEVFSHTSPNPLGNPETLEAAGALAITMRSLRVLLIPFQKALQYYYWKNPTPGFEVEKPTFTRKDAFYLGLDITLLALTIAAFAVGAHIPAAAIALSAAVISATVAGVQYGKGLYQEHQLKKEKSQIDALRDKLEQNPQAKLSDNEQKLLDSQITKADLDSRKHENIAVASLNACSESLGARIKASITDRYRRVRQTLGFGLTMLAIVSASLMLAGVVLGPVGVPLIMAGVGLSLTTAAIAGGMMIANTVKRRRDNKQAELNQTEMIPLETITHDSANKSVSTRLIVDRVAANDREFHVNPSPNSMVNMDEDLVNPFLQEKQIPVSKSSIFNKLKRKAHNDEVINEDIEMKSRDGKTTTNNK